MRYSGGGKKKKNKRKKKMVMKGKISRILKIRVFVFFNQRCNDDRSDMIRGLIENEAE